MKSIRFLLCLSLALVPFHETAFAQYNPAKDNPYVRPAGGSKKWYEFYKSEPSSPYTTKNAGYWKTADQDNALERGVKYVAWNLWEIAKAAV